MAFVLTTSSDVHCPSQGTITPAGQAKLIVAGAEVARLDGIMGKSVTGCTITDSSSTVQCKNVVSASGAAGKLMVGSVAVALDTLTGATDGSTPGLAASAGQSKLRAV
jgi:hypothetical protein